MADKLPLANQDKALAVMQTLDNYIGELTIQLRSADAYGRMRYLQGEIAGAEFAKNAILRIYLPSKNS